MTAYITRDRLIQRFGAGRLRDLTDTDGTGEINDDTLTEAIGLVEGEIDAHLSGRYPLPLATVPALLTGIAGDLVLVRLHVDAAPEPVLIAAKRAREMLAQIRDGGLEMGLPSLVPTASPSPIAYQPGVGAVTGAISDYLG